MDAAFRKMEKKIGSAHKSWIGTLVGPLEYRICKIEEERVGHLFRVRTATLSGDHSQRPKVWTKQPRKAG